MSRVAEKKGKPLYKKDGELLLLCIENPDNQYCKGKIEGQSEKKELYRNFIRPQT
jgi:hypothetical protein